MDLDEDEDDNNIKSKKDTKKREKENVKVKIDLNGIINRIQPIPIREGKYYKLSAAEDKIFVLKEPLQGELAEVNAWNSGKQPKYTLLSYDLKIRKEKVLSRKNNFFFTQFSTQKNGNTNF